MACEITAVNDDLDDATIALLKTLLFLMKKIHFCAIDGLGDHRAIFRSMDQLSRLSFTTMILSLANFWVFGGL
ncbi:hypothetical protein PAPYR_13181 [Paratrimastix pyriformis]|uniref:Uncharacterized protein n=1 Tax=Paratrimastix pyriformis TaxID=342808 RepID=A0ABQ8U0P1_9EUKA|nr:hypothetical protein PAPYR_13181 [Paratrimastix pyriformis]